MSRKRKVFTLAFLGTSLLTLTSCDTSEISDRIAATVNNMLPNVYITLMQLLLFVVTAVVVIYLAYKPVKKKLKQRADFIKQNIDESKKKNEEASQQLKKANDIVFQSQKKAGQIIQEAQITAENKSQTIETELAKSIEAQKLQAHKDIEAEREKMLKDAKSQVVDAAINTSKEILKREIKKEDNDRLIDEFIDCLDK